MYFMWKEKEVLDLLDGKKADAILVSNSYNIRYLSGFTGSAGYLYISKKRKALLTDFRYTFQAKTQVFPGIEVIETGTPYYKMLRTLFLEDDIQKVIFEGKDMLYMDFMVFKRNVKDKEDKEVVWEPLEEELYYLRAVKTKEEIEKMREAENIGDLAFLHILNVLKPGMTELEVAAELEYAMKKNGAEGFSFDTIAASGLHSSMPHAVPTNKRIEKGEFLVMDFGCIYQGYCSDMTRTVMIGKADRKQKKMYDTVFMAQKEAFDFIKAGYKGNEIDKTARDYIYANGYEGCFGHGLGHSVGLFIHENPRFSPLEEAVIPIGAVMTVEPGIYMEGAYGVRIEDLITITETGCENLTASVKELIEI